MRKAVPRGRGAGAGASASSPVSTMVDSAPNKNQRRVPPAVPGSSASDGKAAPVWRRPPRARETEPQQAAVLRAKVDALEALLLEEKSKEKALTREYAMLRQHVEHSERVKASEAQTIQRRTASVKGLEATALELEASLEMLQGEWNAVRAAVIQQEIDRSAPPTEPRRKAPAVGGKPVHCRRTEREGEGDAETPQKPSTASSSVPPRSDAAITQGNEGGEDAQRPRPQQAYPGKSSVQAEEQEKRGVGAARGTRGSSSSPLWESRSLSPTSRVSPGDGGPAKDRAAHPSPGSLSATSSTTVSSRTRTPTPT